MPFSIKSGTHYNFVEANPILIGWWLHIVTQCVLGREAVNAETLLAFSSELPIAAASISCGCVPAVMAFLLWWATLATITRFSRSFGLGLISRLKGCKRSSLGTCLSDCCVCCQIFSWHCLRWCFSQNIIGDSNDCFRGVLPYFGSLYWWRIWQDPAITFSISMKFCFLLGWFWGEKSVGKWREIWNFSWYSHNLSFRPDFVRIWLMISISVWWGYISFYPFWTSSAIALSW